MTREAEKAPAERSPGEAKAGLKRLAQEMFPIFASLHIHREALAALGFLRQAAEAERASQTVVAKVAAFLKRAQHDPNLRFKAPPA